MIKLKKLILLLLFFIVLTPLVFATDWNISTVIYDNVSISTIKVTILNSVTGISFKPDGTKLYVLNHRDGKIYQYTISHNITPNKSYIWCLIGVLFLLRFAALYWTKIIKN